MKKIIIFFVIILIIVAGVSYIYLNYKATVNQAKTANVDYEAYKDKEIFGTDLATLINKVTDSNIKNEVEKDDKGLYIDNGEDSIRIDIKFTDDDTVHSMEEIYDSGTTTFMQYYNQIRFKCSNIEYHEKTGKVSYMYFEQISTN
mgnify:FL=1